jgi:protease-4
MALDKDYLLENRLNKKSLLRWKIVAALMFLVILLLALAIMPTGSRLGSTGGAISTSDHIARITLQEVIFDDLERARNIEALKDDAKVKAVILHINSPGGSVVGSEMIYNALRRVASVKPVVAVMDSLAASGGYLVALGADYIVAHNGTLTGSIGVIMQSAEVTELAAKLGINFENFKSSALKASPNPTEKTSPQVRQAVMENIDEVYYYFIKQVSIRRKIQLEKLYKIADGRIYSAQQALNFKLIDEIGDETTALLWLQQKKSIAKHLKVVDTRIKPRENPFNWLLDDMSNKILGIFYPGFKLLM